MYFINEHLDDSTYDSENGVGKTVAAPRTALTRTAVKQATYPVTVIERGVTPPSSGGKRRVER